MSNNNNCLESLTLIQRTDEEEFIYNSITYGEIMRGANGEWMRWLQNSWGMILLSLCVSMTTGNTRLHAGEATTQTKRTSAKPPQVSRIKPRQAPPVKLVSLTREDEKDTGGCPHCKPSQAPPIKRSRLKTKMVNSPCSGLCVCGCNDGEECTCGNAVITGQHHTPAHTHLHMTHTLAPAPMSTPVQGMGWWGFNQWSQVHGIPQAQTQTYPTQLTPAQMSMPATAQPMANSGYLFLPGGSDDCPPGVK